MSYKGVVYANCSGTEDLLTCNVRGAKPTVTTPLGAYNFQKLGSEWYFCGEGSTCSVPISNGEPDQAYRATVVRYKVKEPIISPHPHHYKWQFLVRFNYGEAAIGNDLVENQMVVLSCW